MYGTHTGAFMNNPPTGKSFTIDVIDIMRFANGKMVEHWGSPDRFALLVQLGFWAPKKYKKKAMLSLANKKKLKEMNTQKIIRYKLSERCFSGHTSLSEKNTSLK